MHVASSTCRFLTHSEIDADERSEKDYQKCGERYREETRPMNGHCYFLSAPWAIGATAIAKSSVRFSDRPIFPWRIGDALRDFQNVALFRQIVNGLFQRFDHIFLLAIPLGGFSDLDNFPSGGQTASAKFAGASGTARRWRRWRRIGPKFRRIIRMMFFSARVAPESIEH